MTPHWLVIDLEATTDEGGWPIAEMEIIEIGACMVDANGRELDHFQRFVKPERRPQLTPFCRKLTHIRQTDIDRAAALTQVWPEFERWLARFDHGLLGWVSWGDYDRQQLLMAWDEYDLKTGLAQVRHVNLKQRFAKARHLQRPTGLNGALQLAGLQFSGTQHRALFDARNTARLLPLALPEQYKTG